MYEIIEPGSPQEFEAFIEQHPKGHFLQTRAWGRQKPFWQWRGILVRDSEGSIRGAMSVRIRKSPMTPYTLMYAA